MYRSSYNRYKENRVMLSSQERFYWHSMMGPLSFAVRRVLRLKVMILAPKDKKIGSVMAILTELSATLDFEKAPELCENLSRLMITLLTDCRSQDETWMSSLLMK